MNILAFETTDRIAGVALLIGQELFSVKIDDSKRHAETVLCAAEKLLHEHELELCCIDAFAVDVGPGSFTGVRIGVCTANALGLALNKPVIAVNALEAICYGKEHPVCAIIDAKNGNGYAAFYSDGKTVIEPCACVNDELAARLPIGMEIVTNAMPSAEAVALIASCRKGEKQASPMYLRPSQAERLHPEL
ncbi:MAG TPA: tRNA (adenosine(37)-N6)-threonylcarbamoyltransferase complex dimerization subunit type 1 TsaB [Eubacteriales bacterium]|nr:tRNA (adenosine(37)-N6)-threonylcarbamoyltransferase complex dimerization subunit type 1 TsaB [Eubacteriales bacterium]